MYYGWAPYVPVAKKISQAKTYAAKAAKKAGRAPAPVKSNGRKIATSFWGKAWCDNLDRYGQIANRLARGRTYLGNGSVVDLQIKSGQVEAIVAGSEPYEVTIRIKTLQPKLWKAIKQGCANSIHSLLDLLQGRFDEAVMQQLVDQKTGLFPQVSEIEMDCSCPDYATVCKHVAAVVYGIGTRLDAAPELLFTLRNVDHSELITQAVAAENLEQTLSSSAGGLAGVDLNEMFGIELVTEASPSTPSTKAASTKAVSKRTPRKAATKVSKTVPRPKLLKKPAKPTAKRAAKPKG